MTHRPILENRKELKTEPDQWQVLEQTLRSTLKGLRYGSIELIIHDSKIVQVERREKIRAEVLQKKRGFDPMG
jgi:hypothetical protein